MPGNWEKNTNLSVIICTREQEQRSLLKNRAANNYFIPLSKNEPEMVSTSIFIFYCCCNKLPQTNWLKTIHFFFFIWQLRRSDVCQESHLAESKVLRAAFLSAGSWWESIYLPFPASRSCMHSLAHNSSIFKVSNAKPSPSHAAISLVLYSIVTASLSIFKDPCDYIELIQVLLDRHPIFIWRSFG